MLGLPFVLFVVVMTGTPGPGNLAHMAIGQTTGFRSALPFLAGTTVGAVCVDSVVALGVGKLLVASAVVGMALKIVGTAYILYLAWKVVQMDVSVPENVKRFSFLDGVFIHPLSPKTWAMSLAAFSQFSDPAAPLISQTVVFVLTFMFFQVFFHSLWCVTGVGLMRVLHSNHVRVAVNCVVALIMVGVTLQALLA